MKIVFSAILSLFVILITGLTAEPFKLNEITHMKIIQHMTDGDLKTSQTRFIEDMTEIEALVGQLNRGKITLCKMMKKYSIELYYKDGESIKLSAHSKCFKVLKNAKEVRPSYYGVEAPLDVGKYFR